MLSIDEAFRRFKSRLELNDRERKNASDRQNEVREYLDTKFAIERSFLTGSYYYCVRKYHSVSGGRPQERQGSRCSSARARSSYAVAMDVGTWRSGRTGSAPRLETFGKASGAEEGERLRGGKPRALGGEVGIGRDT